MRRSLHVKFTLADSRSRYPVALMAQTLLLIAGLSACQSETPPIQGTQKQQSPVVTSVTDMSGYPLLPLERLMAQPQYSVPQVSPDGRLISWIGPLEGSPNLFVADVSNPTAARPITQYTDDGVRATDVSGNVLYRWHWDSHSIIFPRDYGGDEHWDIHIVDVTTGEVRNLTPMEDKAVEIIGYGRKAPDELLVKIEVFGQGQPDVYRLNLMSGETELVMPNSGFLGFLADNDLNVRMGVKYSAQQGLDFYRLNSDGSWENLYQVTADDLPAFSTAIYQKMIRFDQANEHVYIYDAQNRDKAALVKINLNSGELTLLAEDDRVDIAGVLYHPVENRVQAYATTWLRNKWHAMDESLLPDFKRLGEISEGDWHVLSRSDDDRYWIVRYRLSHEPTAFYLYDRGDGSRSITAQRLFSATPQLEGLELSKLHPYIVTTDDGFDLVSYYMLPPWSDPDQDGMPNEPVPMIVLVHGGPSDERALFAFGALLHWFANRGYGTMYVNFRGSAGFGKAYMNAQTAEWGGRMHQDILDQVDWAVSRNIADAEKIALLGGSYGGYEVLVGMTMTPDVFACGIDIVGPSNLEVFMPHWNVDTMSVRLGGDPRTAEGREFLRSRSPINFAGQTRNPVLIGQGANDSRVPQDQSDTVVEKMQAAGVEVTYVVYPDEGHGFLRPANSNAFNAIMEVFLANCLGGRYEPIANQIEGSSTQVPVGVEHIEGLAGALARRTDTGLPKDKALD